LRSRLLQALVETGVGDGHSSVHVNFHDGADAAAFGPEWMARLDVQYHWSNDAGWRDFRDFLDAFDHKHRKNIRQERSRVEREGVTFRVVSGSEATEADLAAMHDFYVGTFEEYGNHPALTLGFLQHLASSMPDALVLIIAERDGRPIAGALCIRGHDTLYGRYWGASERVPALHFETCYYQGIEYCLRNGLTRFEPGAQGEHKLARGFLPRFVHSHHWIAHPQFREALRDWCRQEAGEVRRYATSLARHTPFKQTDASATDPAAD
jgi:predicted N-acyltransferase